MGTVPQGISPGDWTRARLKACHKHLIRHRGRKLVDEHPGLVRRAFLDGHADTSDNVEAFIHDTRYCGHCGGVGTLPDQPETICLHCRRGRKLLPDGVPQAEPPEPTPLEEACGCLPA